MMKKITTIILVILANVAFAEQISFSKSVPTGLNVVSQTGNTTVFVNTISEMELDRVTVQGMNFTALHLDGYVRGGEIGDPNLPAVTRLLTPVIGTTIEVRVLASEYTDISLNAKGFTNQLMPVEQDWRKSDPEPPMLIVNQEAFSRTTFNDRDLVDLTHFGSMRDEEVFRLNINPIRYLASENIIRVYHHLEFEVIYTFGPELPKKPLNAKPIYQVVAHRTYEAANSRLNEFLAWKTEQGYDVRVIWSDQFAGTGETFRTNMKNHLQGLYNNLATRPDYLLIVGNNTQIPAYPPGSGVMGSGHLTDLYYVTYGNPNHYSTGYANENQFLPDVAYGRLPHATVTELNNHIEKMLHVDKRLGDLEYFKRSIGIAGSETGLFRREADVTVDYAALHYFNASNGGSATVIKAPGYSDASIVTPFRNAFNAGAIYVNYTAHCNYDRWDTDVLRYSPATHQNNVHNFTNTGMYPLMVGNCCISAGLGGSVSPGVSIGAHAVQAQQRGGSTYIGGSNSTYWGADFFWSIGSMNTQQRNNPESVLPDPSLTGLGVYDRLFHTNFNERINDMHQIMAYGNRALMQSSANSDTRMIKYYWEIYHVFGDPSMMPSFGPQTTISIDDISMLTAIDQELVIQAVPHARVALTLDGELLATAMANATGLATLVFTEELPIGDAKLVITARNRIPYIATVPIMPANMPLLRVNDYRLNKNSGNVERMVFGEQVDFDFYLHNRSLVAAENIQIALTYDNTFVTIETFAPITTIAGQDGIWTPKRKITADINIPNNYDLEVTANITYFDNAGEEYNLEHTFNILAAAPQFVVSDFTANATNGSFTLTNVGLEPISGVQMQLTNLDNQLTVSNLSPATANFTIDNKLPFTFNVVKNVSDEFFVYSLKLTFSKGQFLHERPLHSAFGTFIEDFETGDFREPLWWREEGTEFGWHIVDTITTFTLEGVPIDNSGNAFEGKYAMRSNKIGHGQSTSVETDEFVLFGGDSIVFYYKVSSEDCSGTPNDCIDGGDALVFYTGSGSGWKREKAWYGEIPWTRAAIAVEEGPAFFKWAYEKNPKNSRGHDAAWVDYIVFPKLRQMSPPTSVTPPVVSLPDHILFDVVVNNGQLHARINADTYGKATIRLHNTLGQPVATIASNNTVNEGQNDFYFDMSNLPKGVYICTYFDGNRQLARKIIW